MTKILLFKGRGLISSLIRWQTRSIYSHAALYFPDAEDSLKTGLLIESWQGVGVRIKDVGEDFDWKDIDIFDIEGVTSEQSSRMYDFASAQIGKKYDYTSVLRFVSRIKTKENGKFFCSELVVAAMEAAGLVPLKRIQPSQVSPALLAISPILS